MTVEKFENNVWISQDGKSMIDWSKVWGVQFFENTVVCPDKPTLQAGNIYVYYQDALEAFESFQNFLRRRSLTEYASGFEDGQKKERRDCWDAINKYIKIGDCPGNGCDEQAQRNGMVLASNIVMERIKTGSR